MKGNQKGNAKKRPLDMECLAANRYGVVASTGVSWPGHPVKFDTAIQKLRQAAADLKRARPEGSHCEVVIDLHLDTPLKLVVAATTQGALVGNVDQNPNGQNIVNAIGSKEVESDSGPRHVSIDASALAEAEQIAALTAKISIGAIDVGNSIVRKAEEHGLTLENAAQEFTRSPDENVSRKTYARAGGPTQVIRYSLGERALGGGHKVSKDICSTDTFSLRHCQLIPGGRDGGFVLRGKDSDPEWRRLTDQYPALNILVGNRNSKAMQLLGYAMSSDILVDVDVCLSERVGTQRQKLIPIIVRNYAEIITGVRDRLEILEEGSS